MYCANYITHASHTSQNCKVQKERPPKKAAGALFHQDRCHRTRVVYTCSFSTPGQNILWHLSALWLMLPQRHCNLAVLQTSWNTIAGAQVLSLGRPLSLWSNFRHPSLSWVGISSDPISDIKTSSSVKFIADVLSVSMS